MGDNRLLDVLSVLLVALVLLVSVTTSQAAVIYNSDQECNLALQQVLEEKVQKQAELIIMYQEAIRVLTQMNEEKAILINQGKTYDDMFLDDLEEQYGPMPDTEINQCKE